MAIARPSACLVIGFNAALLSVAVEVEQVHQVADGWAVQRNVGIVAASYGVGEVVAVYDRCSCDPRP
jgi:hypothetical protein